jgi:hypothetical protein
MAAATQHTDPGYPHPGYGSTGALAHPAKPSGNDERYPRPLPLLLAEHAKVPHQDHPNGASEPVSLPLLALQQPHPSAVSPLAAVPPAALAPGIPPPPAREVPHLHIHQQTTNKGISIYTSKAGPLVYQQHKYKSQKPKTSHTSMIEYLPRRQHHVRVPPEIHSRIWEPEDKLRRLPPDLCGLL